ncbi:MAG: hypothetical protein KatS3mg131_0043 [Candidatus Tectimicrobiota bacterium]|nr:MAG: hypothetical protein KatS3mg131_0043 [Candidatus Tectomicrobia bacterium]
MRTVALSLPLPPSINHQYATVAGRRVLSRAGRAFKALVAEAVERWLEAQQVPRAALAQLRQHTFALHITFYFDTAWRRDLDGGLKITQDALCEALGINDTLVVEIHLYKRVDPQLPRTELCLTALERAALPASAPPAEVPWWATAGKSRRRRRRRLRSLAELAARYQWEGPAEGEACSTGVK